jgi:hypothetical protein
VSDQRFLPSGMCDESQDLGHSSINQASDALSFMTQPDSDCCGHKAVA